MDGTIYFGKIYIVEWLRPDAKKTGWELFDELEPMGIMSKPEVHVTFQRIHTRAEFIAFLRTIEADFRATRQLPLLHIEAHGSADGIGLSAEDSVLWPELMRELIPP